MCPQEPQLNSSGFNFFWNTRPDLQGGFERLRDVFVAVMHNKFM